MKKQSYINDEYMDSAIIGMWRMGANPVEIVGGIYEGTIYDVAYVQLVIDNYIKSQRNNE